MLVSLGNRDKKLIETCPSPLPQYLTVLDAYTDSSTFLILFYLENIGIKPQENDERAENIDFSSLERTSTKIKAFDAKTSLHCIKRRNSAPLRLHRYHYDVVRKLPALTTF